MKVRFFSLLAVLVIVIAGFSIYLIANKDKYTSDKDNPTKNVTGAPTVTPLPTLTPVPADFENAPSLYPAYQLIDGTKTYGYINSDNKFAIKPSFDSAGDFHEGVAVVHMDKQYLAIDTKGAILYYSENPIGDSHNGFSVVSRNSGENTVYGYIDNNGKEIIKPLYKYASNFGIDNTAYVYSGSGKYAQIDKNGKTLKTFELDQSMPYSIDDGYVIYYNSDKNLYGVVNLQGEEIFKPKYVEILYMGYDLFALKKQNDDYYGMYSEMPSAIFNAKGEQITDFTLFDITRFFNGYASATDSTYTYFIGQDGKEVTTLPKYEGRGTVKLFENVIKAEIDHDLLYSTTDNNVIWQNDNNQTLSGSIMAKSVKFKSNKDVLVYYPQMEGLGDNTVQQKINSELKKIFTKARANLKESDQYIVEDTFKASMIKDLLIIERDGYDYPYGAAHGSPIMDYYYIDTKTGTFYELKDLFIPGSDYVKAINDMITAKIKDSTDENMMYFENGFTGIKENQYFILSPDTLTIYFYPYDIAAYAAGFPKFEIPIEDLYDYIDFTGAFWGSFN